MKPRSFRDRKKVLIVEDEPLVQQVLKRYLGILGYQVICCSGATEALKQTRDESPDVIILDLSLPEMNGLELYRLLLENNGSIPTVLTSAYEVSKEDFKRAKELGIRGFLRKPFGFGHLKSVVHDLCHKRHFRLTKSRFFFKEPFYNLKPRSMAQKVFRKVFRAGLDRGGHVHFYVEGCKDHLILLCSQHTLGKVIAKSPECEKGKYIKWEQSSFAGYDPDDIFADLSQKINLVKVDVSDYEMSWPTLADFLCWLELNY